VVVEWLDARGIDLQEASAPRDVLAHAVGVAEKYGIGRRALSNFDCFHYAHAKAAGVPLLTLDQHLQQTDLSTRP
jgi:ribonuclease VapC